MAIPRVDDVRYRVDQHPPRLTVWLFNDDSFYAGAALKRVTRYDFDRRFNPDGTSPDRKEKLDVGIYRTPFRDGWRYTISSDVHEPLCALIIRYATHGWKTDENGERVPATYLRHNRKALGIFDLIKRYLLVRDECLLVNDGLPEKIVDIVKCKNPRCITTTEQGIKQIFKLTDSEKRIYRCVYCEAENQNEIIKW